ncbi:hypothetical protein [Sphingobium sp. EP60837]|uniref:hypothetical protein n=1 Tax=Sphingobium sp. EP60837 TaxID=1855519 RepID=UPI0007DD17FF|nr:hypothetical protein [Sphingobium sp. EP60837]ANI78278.1 hypothetical protein EP837_01866 [Sphingobium sp. EP60837]
MTSIDHIRQPRNLIGNQGSRLRGKDPLPRLLVQLLERAGEPAIVERAASRPWASALFQGRRHVIALRLSGPDAQERRAVFAAGLEEAEWSLPRHFVADITIDGGHSAPQEEVIELSALTIEDW